MPNLNTDLITRDAYNHGGTITISNPRGEPPIHVKAENTKARFEYKGLEGSRQSDEAMEIAGIMALRK